jgi:Fic family protein
MAKANSNGNREEAFEKARFIPIAPEGVDAGMSGWEKYLHEDTPDRIVQLAIVHAEFESLHPFLDGNGRIGRMILPLFLFDQKLLHAPMFYLSEYLEANRQEYYDRLLAVSRDDDWTGWCQFFLEALTRQANQNESKVRQILELYQKRKNGSSARPARSTPSGLWISCSVPRSSPRRASSKGPRYRRRRPVAS